jgi:hypothetical protein
MLANRFVGQRTSTPVNIAAFLYKSISTLIITLAYQYASCSSGVLVRVAFYCTGHDAIGIHVCL